MNILPDLSSMQLLVMMAVILLLIPVGIMIVRLINIKKSKKDFAAIYKDKLANSPYSARSKYPDVNMLRNSPTVFKLGFAISLFMVVGLMNWTQFSAQIDPELLVIEDVVDLEIEPPRTQEAPPPPPPPPPPRIEEVPEELYLEMEEDVEFMDLSVDEETSIVEVEMPKKVKKVEAPPPPPPPPMIEEEVAEIFKIVEEMPRFGGCEDLSTIDEKKKCAERKLMEFIYSNIKYPAVARSNSIKGSVVAKFVVNTDGTMSHMSIMRDIGGGCGDEVIRVLSIINQKHLKWIPGKQGGKNVRVQFILPVKFKLLES